MKKTLGPRSADPCDLPTMYGVIVAMIWKNRGCQRQRAGIRKEGRI